MLLPKPTNTTLAPLDARKHCAPKLISVGRSIQNILWQAQSTPFARQGLMIASDYGGEHKAAGHLVVRVSDRRYLTV